MKKLMFAAALCAAMTGLADVKSANVVGYMTDGVRANEPGAQVFTMFSIPFSGVNGGGFNTEDLKFTGVLMSDNPAAYGDIIQIWKTVEGGVDEYYCYPEDGLWYNCLTDELLTDDHQTLPSGTAFWYIVDMYSEESTGREVPAMTISGAVDNEPFYTFPIRANEAGAQVFTMFSNPFPANWMIAEGDCEIEGALMTDNPAAYGDIIQVWKKAEGGVNEYYCYPEDGLWYNCLTDELLTDDYADGIPAGSAFWYIVDMYSAESAARTETKITFYNPLNKSAE